MKTVTIECRQINEWDDETRAQIIEKHRYINADYERWWDAVYEDAKAVGALMGIEIDAIYFSGFWSQGDGACFEGRWTFKEDAVAAVKTYAPEDEELHRIAGELVKHGRDLTATVSHRGRYYHALCTEIDIDWWLVDIDWWLGDIDWWLGDIDWWLGDVPAHEVPRDQAEFLKDALRDFMKWIYKQLEKEYEYLTSDEAVRQTLAANEYEFDADGRIW